jgi:hypothetical protein
MGLFSGATSSALRPIQAAKPASTGLAGFSRSSRPQLAIVIWSAKTLCVFAGESFLLADFSTRLLAAQGLDRI